MMHDVVGALHGTLSLYAAAAAEAPRRQTGRGKDRFILV